MLIFTNNPLVHQHYPEARWVEGPPDLVLCAVRDAVHMGHRLLLHPFLGNLKPNQAFFRSYVLSAQPQSPIEFTSLSLIEGALEGFRGFGPPPSPPERVTADLQTFDFDLLTTGVRRLKPSQNSLMGGLDPCA